MAPDPRRGLGGNRRPGPALSSGTEQRALLEGTKMAVPLAQLLTPRHLILDSWTHERTFHRPGAGVSCLYRVQAVDRSGSILTFYAGATSAALDHANTGTVQTTLAGLRLTLWLHPHDPLLPALPWALSPPDVARDVFGHSDSDARTVLSLSDRKSVV